MNEFLWQEEGKARFQVGDAFYNPRSKYVRDLGVLAATVYRQDRGSLRVLDALAGCGVRSLRYYQESNADYLYVNEGNPQLNSLLQQNLKAISLLTKGVHGTNKELVRMYLSACDPQDRTFALRHGFATAPDHYRLTHQDAHRVFFRCYQERDYYDLVDVDCFGSAVPYLNSMLWATKIGGLMYLTSTDGRTLTGHPPEKTVQTYNAIARSHPAIQEQALRILIGATQQQAAAKNLGVEPIFSLFTGQTYRVMLRLLSKPQINADNYGFLSYCHGCGNYQTFSWRKLDRVGCVCNNPAITVSGAMWLGKLHDLKQLERFTALAKKLNWQKIVELLNLMQGEIDFPPYFYTLREIGSRGKLDLPKRSHLIAALQDKGYRAAATHIEPQGIKTNARMEDVIAIAIGQ